MSDKKAEIEEKADSHKPALGVRKFLFRITVKSLSSGFIIFTILFVSVASAGLLLQLVPWIFRTGVTDIEPLPILLCSFISGIAGLFIRYWIMKRFSHITVYPHREYPPAEAQEPQEKKESKEPKKDESPSEKPAKSN